MRPVAAAPHARRLPTEPGEGPHLSRNRPAPGRLDAQRRAPLRPGPHDPGPQAEGRPMRDAGSILPHPGPTPKTAADWIGSLNAADCTAEEREQFEQWLKSSEANRAAFARFEKVRTMPARLAGH